MGGILAFLGCIGVIYLVAWGLADRQPVAGVILAIIGGLMFWIDTKWGETEDPMPVFGIAALVTGFAIVGVNVIY